MADSWTFAFVDLAGFTALTDAHGDEHAIATVKSFQEHVRRCLGPSDVLVKTIGDAVMLAFAEPSDAVEALERILSSETTAAAGMLLPRAGAHHGAAIRDEDDFYGHAVNVAARVAAQAAGGQLLVTDAVAMAARDRGHVITHVGSVSLRNIAEPIDLFDVDLEHDETDQATDPVCLMRVPRSGDLAISMSWKGDTVWFCGLPCVARFATAPDEYANRIAPGD
jgi:class 3 adenylate cyclase/YHS domain-containing protein